MTACPFCEIPAHRPHEIIARNDLCYLIHNTEGALEHGVLVIPFRHIATPFEYTAEEWAAIQPLIHEAHHRLLDEHPDGFNLGWNVGSVGGQEISHVHLHVWARFADEPLAGSGIRRWFKSPQNRRPR